jgi:hypothetical protein
MVLLSPDDRPARIEGRSHMRIAFSIDAVWPLVSA